MRMRMSGVLLLSAGLLSGCALSGPSNLRIHEVLLYGGSQERLVWVYGDLRGRPSSARLNDRSVKLTAAGTDALAVPGSLSVNGQSTYRLPTQVISPKLAVTARENGQYSVTPTNAAEVLDVYLTNGSSWVKLGGTSGLVSSVPVGGVNGAGQLTNEEAAALSRSLLGQGSLAVAVLLDSSVPDRILNVDPTPVEYRRTVLYVQPSVPAVQGGTPFRAEPASGVVPFPNLATLPGVAVNTIDLASGTQSSATTLSVVAARTAAEAASLYAQAYARQTGVPGAPDPAGGTLVGVFMGQRNTGGYSVKVLKASLDGEQLTLMVQLRSPGPGAITTQALTSPWTIIRVASTAFSSVKLVDERGQELRAGSSGETR